MRAAWVALLIGCGFQTRPTGSGDTVDAAVPPPVDAVDNSPICGSISLGAPTFTASACAPPAAAIDLATSTVIDTNLGTSTPPGLICTVITNGTTKVCVVAAQSIAIRAGVMLSARGSNPLGLFARAVTIRGTVDVASHATGGVIGAGALVSGCLTGMFPLLAGGGHGGGAFGQGGQGGDQGGEDLSGGIGGYSFSIVRLIGGCGGTRGGDGSAGGGNDGGATTGGAGGGAVWIVSDPGELAIEDGGAINASGAGGVGGASEAHGGAGGGAGGLIVLQASRIRLAAGGAVFANGGHGGGGAGVRSSAPGFIPGGAGTDPGGPQSGGSGGAGGVDGESVAATDDLTPGTGGTGFPATATNRNGLSGGDDGRGGGGGGGGEGAIRVVSTSRIDGTNVSPPPVYLQ